MEKIEPKKEENNNNQIKPKEKLEKIILTYTAKKKDLYGIYLDKDETVIVKSNQE